MAASLRDIILIYIDESLDVDDLENIGDYVRSVLTTENIEEWQLHDALKLLHSELVREQLEEKNPTRRSRLRAALSCFEGDFADYLITRETETLHKVV